jgi:ferrochelatase
LQQLIVLPLYPHYAMSSYETAVVQIRELYARLHFKSSLTIVPPYYNDADYIEALSASMRPYLSQPFDHLLFSYHGIPERHLKKTGCTEKQYQLFVDCCAGKPSQQTCYRHQVMKTTELVAAKLGLEKQQYSYSFQSRLGRDAWLQPFTVEQLKSFPARGIKKLLIACPAFVSDCLETLEEIEEEGREDFLKYGGESFTMIPAMNESKLWIDCMEKLVRKGEGVRWEA